MSSYASRTCRRAPSPRHTLSMTSVRAMRYTPEPSLLTALQAVPHRAPPAHSNEHRDRVTPTTAISTDHRAASSHRGGSGQRWDRSAILHIPSEDLQGGEKYPSSTRRHWPHIYNEGLWRSSMIKRHNRPWFKFRFWREFEFGRCDIPPIHRRRPRIRRTYGTTKCDKLRLHVRPWPSGCTLQLWHVSLTSLLSRRATLRVDADLDKRRRRSWRRTDVSTHAIL